MIQKPLYMPLGVEEMLPVPAGNSGNHRIGRGEQIADKENFADADADAVGTVSGRRIQFQDIASANGDGLLEQRLLQIRCDGWSEIDRGAFLLMSVSVSRRISGRRDGKATP